MLKPACQFGLNYIIKLRTIVYLIDSTQQVYLCNVFTAQTPLNKTWPSCSVLCITNPKYMFILNKHTNQFTVKLSPSILGPPRLTQKQQGGNAQEDGPRLYGHIQSPLTGP